MLDILILGSAAGGGFPQWNCNDPASRRARAGDPNVRPRTQSSLAVSADGRRWVVLNASPDLRQQINQRPQLHPAADGAPRSTPIAAVALTNADVDHVAGLLNLREGQPFALYGHPRVLGVLAQNAIFNVLDPAVVLRRDLPLDEPVALAGPDGARLGLEITAFRAPGKIALWLEEAGAADFGSRDGDTVGLKVAGAGGSPSFFYIPGCAAMPAALAERLRGAALVIFDGTLWRDDEMIVAGVGGKSGLRMGHMSVAGESGTMAAFAGLDVGRKILIHINNTNPLLIEDSPQRAEVVAAGWEVAFDGMEISL
ncbi:MAG: pyrroloquinoline quinone biosynthesis protein PqqB [Caulobacteraceae bacterium]